MRKRVFRAVAFPVAIVMLICLSACSASLGLPTDGPVQSLQTVEPHDKTVFTDPQGPVEGASPEEIVRGFLNAIPAGVQNDGYRVACQYLTARERADWKGDEKAEVVTGGTISLRSEDSSTFSGESGGHLARVGVLAEVVGALDVHGMFTPEEREFKHIATMDLKQVGGQWRISSLPQGIVISVADFDRSFRQVSLYRVDASGRCMVPDVRWLSWRNWKARAVDELLNKPAAWLSGAVMPLPKSMEHGVRATVVPRDNGGIKVVFQAGLAALSQADRSMISYEIHLTLGDGNPQADVSVGEDDGGGEYSSAGIHVPIIQQSGAMYSLSAGHIVALSSSNPLRIGDVNDASNVKSFVYTDSQAAIQRSDGTVECLSKSGSTCGPMFGGLPMISITEGVDGEIWALGQDGVTLHVLRGGHEQSFMLKLARDVRIRSFALAPEGDRMALAIDGQSDSRVVMVSMTRKSDGFPIGLGETLLPVSMRGGISLLTFYNDITLVYANDAANANQQAWTQQVSGPEREQRLQSGHITGLSVGKVDESLRLVALDDQGFVRSVAGSLESTWVMADSQALAISNR